MASITVNSQFSLGNKIDRIFSTDEIKNEPMLFSCSVNNAVVKGRDLTWTFIKNLPEEWINDPTCIIDSRVHMLKTGWFPAIPGYHHDDVPRSREDGQPNYVSPEYRSQHAMMLVNADVCPTAFAVGEKDFVIPDIGETIYRHWHKDVVRAIGRGELELQSVPDKQIVFFDDRTWHQATPAVKDGWRFFIRASRSTHRKPSNEIRRQVQVYMANPMEGW